MSMDLTGINNYNEYYTNHYFASIFEENAQETISAWRSRAKESEEIRTPWSMLRENSRHYYKFRDKYLHSRGGKQLFPMIRDMAGQYLISLGFPTAAPILVEVAEGIFVPVYLEIKKPNGAPLLWVMLAHTPEREGNIMQGYCFHASDLNEDNGHDISITTTENEELATKILFSLDEPPRWIIFIGLNQIALIDRNKWNAKRYLHFDLEEIFSRREETTFQAMTVLLHYESLCPKDGLSLLDKLDENSHRHSSGVSQDLKYALRESIELLGNEVTYDLVHRQGRNLDTEPVNDEKLTIECMRYMYRMLFMLFIEARPELGYAPMKAQAYVQGYSLESLRDIADNIREETSEVGEGYYLHETISKLFELIYNGYPGDEETLKELAGRESLHDVFIIEPLKAHIFDPEYTPMITAAKLRNCVMLKIIDLMSITRSTGRRNDRRGRISYSNLGINQMGAVYEALLSYRGFIAEETLFEVKRERDRFDELDVGYFVPERELDNYTEGERVRYESGENIGKLRKYEKGTFIYRLAGREREKSASYYTPEVLTKCLVKYALKELLEGKTADEIIELTICEPAMGSAAFLNEAINQLAEAYLDKKQKDLGETISSENRNQELQRVKMYIADRNVYGIDLNPVAVELAEVSLWLNTIYKGAYVPWFGTQLVNGNSLIGARRQCYRIEQLKTNRASERWYDHAPERIMPGKKRMPKKQVYHFLMGDPGMANYTDRVIKVLAPDKIQAIKKWNRRFVSAYNDEDIQMLLRLSAVIDHLWAKQVELQKTVDEKTADALSVYGHEENMNATPTTIREKDLIYKRLYKSEEMKNAGPYARLKFAMDYWCALWFWPIDKADLLPSRSEFLFDMSLILEGGIASVTQSQNVQLSLFPTEIDEMANEVLELYKGLPEVDLAALCERNDRLKLAKEIADKNKFMHWELEFADLFEERGGFDLIIGNPPWIKLEWKESNLLQDFSPIIALRNLSANETSNIRKVLLDNKQIRDAYIYEYELTSSIQGFLNAIQNYDKLSGGSVNLYKNFLPQSWMYGNKKGIIAFIHQENIFDDSNSGQFRAILYPKLRRHYHFINELRLFPEIHHSTVFSLNVYSNNNSSGFDCIFNLYTPNTIDQCYETTNNLLFGLKDDNNNWNVYGHKDRLIHVGNDKLRVFAKLFDDNENVNEARLAVIHAKQLLSVLKKLLFEEKQDIKSFSTLLWTETSAQSNGLIKRVTHYPDIPAETILLGAQIYNTNPLFKCARANSSKNSDYDIVDLRKITDYYLPRCNYSIFTSRDVYRGNLPTLPWGGNYDDTYKIFARKMIDPQGERTLVSCIIPPGISHTDGIRGVAYNDLWMLCYISGLWSSIPYDFIVKTLRKENFTTDTIDMLPIPVTKLDQQIVQRTLMLNALTKYYADLWESVYSEEFKSNSWAKDDKRLSNTKFKMCSRNWSSNNVLKSDFERRQAQIEIDVLVAMALGLTLEELKTIYRIQFSVLKKYENDTWYDQNGRIVFSVKNLGNATYKRPEWNEIKDAKSGTFTRTIIDDTMPGGPIERTIEYVAPFDRCDREQDYEIAWAFFEERFKDKDK